MDDDVPTDIMPPRGHSTAPTFDPTHPIQLYRYFSDIAYLFDNCGITDDQERKRFARHYVDIDTSDLWSFVPEAEPGYTWSQFVKAVLEFYPGTAPDRLYSLSDLDQIIGTYLRRDIDNIEDFG